MTMNLKQLSESLGLSPTTVSRALNGYPEVSEQTRLRVMRAARDADYRPDPRAKGLATGRALAIGHVLPTSVRTEIVNPVFADFLSGAGDVYASAGYDMILRMVANTEEEATYDALAKRRAVDGVIVHAPRVDEPRIDQLLRLGLPFVVHGQCQRAQEDYPWVDTNNRRAFEAATERLIALGHHRIALLNGDERMDFARRRRAGHLDALSAAGLTQDNSLLFNAEMTEAYGYETARSLLESAAPPTAFLTSALTTAFGVRRAADELGLRLGEHIALITHDDDLSYLSNGRPGAPVFAATRSSVRAAGRLAAELLMDIIAHPGSAPRTHMLEAEQLDGPSLCPGPHHAP